MISRLTRAALGTVILSVTACAADIRTPASTAITEVMVIATDFALTAPDTLAAGLVRWRLENRGMVPHHLIVVKIAAGHSYDEYHATVEHGDPTPDWVTSQGGPEGSTNASDSISVTAQLGAGEYALLCALTGGGGGPHDRRGMIRRLVVVPSNEAPALDPVATDTLRLVDFAFGFPDTLVAGRIRFRIENHGTQRHHAAISQFPDSISYESYLKLAPTWTDENWPLIDRGGFTSLSPGQHAWYETTLQPGTYLLECLINDPTSGKMHVDLGMVRKLTVVADPTES